MILKDKLEKTVAAYTFPLPSDHVSHKGIETLSQQIAEQHEQLQAPDRLPDGLRRPPFTWSKKLQNITLRLFGLILKNQKRFNLLITQTFEQTLNIQRLSQKDVYLLRAEIAQLRDRELEMKETLLKLYQQVSSLEQSYRELQQSLSSKPETLSSHPS